MSSGWKQLFINLQERAVSADINRLQAFKEKDISELLRYWFDVVGGSDDLNAAGVISEPNTSETPLRAEIINGLMVSPQLGAANLNLFVTPGVAMLLSPDGAADESNFKYVDDAGISTNGVLLMTANASGLIRIDVIECRLNTVDLIVTDNRDIFNPGTGLFTATSVTKERAGRLEYRVRAGTPGAGFPGTSPGWLPLAVASVDAATVGNDTITFWDVRPLLNDREFAPFNLQSDFRNDLEMNFQPVSYVAGLDLTLTGKISLVAQGRRLGGMIRRGTPGADADNIVVGSATPDNIEPGTVFASTTLWYYYLLTPFGLPRWARYTSAPSARVPRSPRGIPVISATPPNVLGAPSFGITLPTTTGLGAGAPFLTVAGKCAFANFGNGAGGPGNVAGEGRRVYMTGAVAQFAASSTTITRAHFDFVPGTHYPANARRFRAKFSTAFNTTGGGSYLDNHIRVYEPGGLIFTNEESGKAFYGVGTGASVERRRQAGWLPVPPVYPVTSPAPTFGVEHRFNGAGAIAIAVTGTVDMTGFEF